MSDGDPIADREALARLNRRQQPEWTPLEPGQCCLCGRMNTPEPQPRGWLRGWIEWLKRADAVQPRE